MKYAPFDKDGNGNTGYLFEITRELACIILRESAVNNLYLKDVDYIHGLLLNEGNLSIIEYDEE